MRRRPLRLKLEAAEVVPKIGKKEFVAPKVVVPEEEAAIGGEAFPAVEKEQCAPIEEAATDSAEAPKASVEENVGEVLGKIDPQAPLASVDEAALMFEEKGVARVWDANETEWDKTQAVNSKEFVEEKTAGEPSCRRGKRDHGHQDCEG